MEVLGMEHHEGPHEQAHRAPRQPTPSPLPVLHGHPGGQATGRRVARSPRRAGLPPQVAVAAQGAHRSPSAAPPALPAPHRSTGERPGHLRHHGLQPPPEHLRGQVGAEHVARPSAERVGEHDRVGRHPHVAAVHLHADQQRLPTAGEGEHRTGLHRPPRDGVEHQQVCPRCQDAAPHRALPQQPLEDLHAAQYRDPGRLRQAPRASQVLLPGALTLPQRPRHHQQHQPGLLRPPPEG
mmetsp:Transcript_1512/g.5349  ORF Transcript_1512/g.5349 Transcript_1512/m.5349 type:complete len:238 (-) Transcript_1512:2253-2966(-)